MAEEKFLKNSDIILINYKLESWGQEVTKKSFKIRSGSMLLRKAKILREITSASESPLESSAENAGSYCIWRFYF